MKKDKRNYPLLTTTIEKEIYDKIEEISKLEGVKRSNLVNALLSYALENFESLDKLITYSKEKTDKVDKIQTDIADLKSSITNLKDFVMNLGNRIEIIENQKNITDGYTTIIKQFADLKNEIKLLASRDFKNEIQNKQSSKTLTTKKQSDISPNKTAVARFLKSKFKQLDNYTINAIRKKFPSDFEGIQKVCREKLDIEISLEELKQIS
jgi:hypothetical protein